MCELVNEALHDPSILRGSHRSPRANRDSDIDQMSIDQIVGKRIRGLAAADHKAARVWPCNAMMPGDRVAVLIKSAAKDVVRHRAIQVVLHIIFTSPHIHHGLSDRLRHADGIGCIIRPESSAESASPQRYINNNALDGQVENPCRLPLRPLRRLRW